MTIEDLPFRVPKMEEPVPLCHQSFSSRNSLTNHTLLTLLSPRYSSLSCSNVCLLILGYVTYDLVSTRLVTPSCPSPSRPVVGVSPVNVRDGTRYKTHSTKLRWNKIRVFPPSTQVSVMGTFRWLDPKSRSRKTKILDRYEKGNMSDGGLPCGRDPEFFTISLEVLVT